MASEDTIWYGLPLKTQVGPAPEVAPEVSLSQAAMQMEARRTTAILVRDGRELIGICTLKDLRKALSEDPEAGKHPVREWMSTPVKTFSKDMGLADAQIAMLRHAISHLVLTEDGTAHSAVTGMIEQKDVLITQSQNPALLVRKIQKAENLDTLLYILEEAEALVEEYLTSGIPLPHLARIKSALTDAVTEKLLNWRIPQIDSIAEIPFAWLALGSLGREEQLLRTDQDNALIYADPSPGQAEKVREGFLELAEGVNRDLDHLGFAYCPAGMMAQNPQWCLPLQQWKQQFSHWIRESDEEGIMHSCIFFDYRNLQGGSELVQALDDHLRSELGSASLFMGYMAVNALKAPEATGFFGRWIREGSGASKGLFDLKARGLMPLADAARVLCLAHGHLHPSGTRQRLAWLEGREPQNAALYQRCSKAYITMMGVRYRSGLRRKDTGRYLDLKELTRGERRGLKEAVKCIQPLKTLLETRFRVSGMR